MNPTRLTAVLTRYLGRDRPLSVAAAGAAIVAALALAAGLAGTANQRLSDGWFASSQAAASGEILIVDIEQAARAFGDGISLPRRWLAALLERSVSLAAERILIDLTLSGPTGTDDDGALERSLTRLGAGRVAIARSAVASRDPSGITRWHRTEVLPRFSASAAVASDLGYDPDGLLRRDGVDASLPVLPRAAAWLAGAEFVIGPKPETIDYGIDARTIPTIDALDLLEGRLSPETITGRRIIVANFATGLGHVVPVPRFGALRRSEVVALAAETLARGQRIRSVGTGWALLALVLVTSLATLWFARLGPIAAAFALVGLSLCGFAAGSSAQRHLGVICPVGSGIMGLTIAFGAALLARLSVFQHVRDACAGLINRTDLRLAKVLDETGEALVTFAPDGQILSMNVAARRIFESEVAGTDASVRDLLGPQSEALFAATKVSRPGRLEATIERSAGGPRHLDLTVNAMPAERGEWIGIASVRDVTDQRAQLDALRRLATEDPLTKLANRAAFDVALDNLCAELSSASDGLRSGVLMIGDLDGFKDVNDTFGHQAGDALLCEVAVRLRAAVPIGALVSRLGGDEFAIVLRDEHACVSGAPALVETITAAIAAPILVNGQTTRIGMSLGMAVATPGMTSVSLVRAADLAMYEIKRASGGRDKSMRAA